MCHQRISLEHLLFSRMPDHLYFDEQFLDKLYKSNPENISLVDDHKHMDQTSEEELIDEAEDTMTILTKYINKIDTEVDKKRLTSLMGTLYNEALHIDQ